MAEVAPFEPITYGKYTLFERLGSGGMAEVFLARQDGAAGFAKKVVVKRILGDYANDASFVEMFLAEARLAAHLSHLNIVQIFDMGQEGDTYFIAMEYVPGPNLLHFLQFASQAQDLRIPGFVRIAVGVAEGLHYAYNALGPDGQELKIVHRDINPPNVIISIEGVPKICDFGVAKSANRESTQGNTLKGKNTYMSPEQIRGQPVDHRADIFSLGVVLFETTTNQRLFKRDTDLGVLHAVLSDPIPLPSQVAPGYPAKLEQIVMWCLERDRSQRCPDGRILGNALEEYLKQDPQGMTQVQVGEWVRSVLPARVRDVGTGPGAFHSLPSLPSVRDTRTPSGWTPSGAAGVARPDTGPRLRPATESWPPSPWVDTESTTSAGSDSFDVVEGTEFGRVRVQERVAPFSVPAQAPVGRWLGVGVGVLGLAAMVAVAMRYTGTPANPKAALLPPGPKAAPLPPAAPQTPEEIAKYYTDEARRLIAVGKYSPAASLVAKAKAMQPAAPQTNVAIAELEEEAEVGARLAGAKQALADHDLERAVSLTKLVLDKEPTQSQALALLTTIRGKDAPTERTGASRRVSRRPGSVSLTAPSGSRVYVDDLPVGQAPLTRYPLPPGHHRIEVRRDGFRPDIHDIRVLSGKDEPVTAELTAKEEVRVALTAARPGVSSESRSQAGQVAALPAAAKPSTAPRVISPEEQVDPPAGPVPTIAPSPPLAPTPAPAPVVAVPAPRGELFTAAMTRPVKISGQDVRYPSDALAASAEGLVIATCDVSIEGNVSACRVIKHVPFMDQAVIASLQSSRMKPATLDGKPVALRSYAFQVRIVAPK